MDAEGYSACRAEGLLHVVNCRRAAGRAFLTRFPGAMTWVTTLHTRRVIYLLPHSYMSYRIATSMRKVFASGGAAQLPLMPTSLYITMLPICFGRARRAPSSCLIPDT